MHLLTYHCSDNNIKNYSGGTNCNFFVKPFSVVCIMGFVRLSVSSLFVHICSVCGLVSSLENDQSTNFQVIRSGVRFWVAQYIYHVGNGLMSSLVFLASV